MRILMTTDAVGGVWRYTTELCRALAPFRCDVDLACLGKKPDAAQAAEIARLSNVTLHASQYRLEWMEDPWEDVERSVDWLTELLHVTRADLLHLNCYGPATGNYDVPMLLVTHSCVYSWWRAVKAAAPGEDWQRYRSCVVRALRTADGVIAPTAAILAMMHNCYTGETDLFRRARVVHNGIDPGRWTAERELSTPFVLGVGRIWDEGKNLRRLAGIASSLSCPVLIAGDGALGEECNKGVVMLGTLSRPQLMTYYRRATVFAHPARYEPFGLAVLEAALSGCPLVLANIASLRELWEGAAQFADPDDSSAWREVVERIVGDPDERCRLARAARARALQYGAAQMAATYAAQYRRLLDRPTLGVA